MIATVTPLATKDQTVLDAADKAVRAVPPVWPLASSVAVNPYLGQTGEDLAMTGARLARVAGAAITMPRAWFAAKIANGEITDGDLQAALDANGGSVLDVAALKAAAGRAAPKRQALPTVADLAAEASKIDWPGIIADRIGAWAAGFFDEGQALWAAPRAKGAWRAWSASATHDLTPELLGLKGFAAFVADAPDDASLMIARAVDRLGLPTEAFATYFHQLLMTMGGWAQVGRYKLWMAELGGGGDRVALEMLAIRLAWEVALFDQHERAIADGWAKTRSMHATPIAPDEDLLIDALLQEAAERAAQRDLAQLLALPAPKAARERPALQAALCIDVRSEVFRRALESLDPRIETLGFAGFFGLGASHRGFASDVEELRLPVLLNPGVHSCSGGAHKDDEAARFKARGARAWGRFKLAAVSSFAFVESAGPLYVAKLVRDALGLKAKEPPREPAPRLHPALPLAARIDAGETILRAMSLTRDFARLVLLCGHGANVVNNPHASALACGACGGYSGEVNARLLAGLLNDAEVRAGLVARGIEIPGDTLFLGALHDTTTDAVTIYTADHPIAGHDPDLAQAEAWLAAAGARARGERAKRLPRAKSDAAVVGRSRDWAEVRPEWALAGCKAFIAAPRDRTAGKSLEGRAFLHNYDWRADETGGFNVLELILTAPVVVASWISLQYYGSTVSPEIFGGGDKTLHNVVGGIGVVEGNGGPLRVGLPWQSVHDGEKLAHEPLRLSVCVEAPTEAMTAILERHPGVRALFDNGWLKLFALDGEGKIAWRYAGGLEWRAEAAAPLAAAA